MGGFVKLDVGILESSLWVERDARDVFLTALLMAVPFEAEKPLPQLEIRSLKETGWSVPPGWYGFVPAAGVGIVRRSLVHDTERGYDALEVLGRPDEASRTPDFDGRRLVRVDGGFVVLNFMKYRDRDYTAAERSKRWRERQKERLQRDATRVDRDDTCDNTHARLLLSSDDLPSVPLPSEKQKKAPNNGEADFARFWDVYDRKEGRKDALAVWRKLNPDPELVAKILTAAATLVRLRPDRKFRPHPDTWLRGERWNDDVVPDAGGRRQALAAQVGTDFSGPVVSKI